MEWNEYRRRNGTIDLIEYYVMIQPPTPMAMLFLEAVEKIQPIFSTQAAAVAIATAQHIARTEDV